MPPTESVSARTPRSGKTPEFKACDGCGKLFTPRAAHARWCSQRCRKAQYRRPCAECGQPCGGSDLSTYCVRCGQARAVIAARARRDERLVAIVALRAEGLLNREIAARLGISPHAVAQLVFRARNAGIEVARARRAAAGHKDL